MWTVYVIRSEVNGRLYVGMSENLEQRIKAHNSGKVFSTKGFKPWILIHTEEFSDSLSSRKREKYLKSGYGKQWLKKKYGSEG